MIKILGKHMLIAALILGGFAIVGAGLVGITFEETKERIASNEREFLLKTLNEMIPPEAYNNSLVDDTIVVRSKQLLGSDEPLTIYRARHNGRPVGAILTAHAQGYSGTIKILIAVDIAGQVGGVRVISHKETPGLGDAIEAERSPWINSFFGHSLHTLHPNHWRVKKEGGVFDQFTGATITPRAVVKAVHNALIFYFLNKAALFSPVDSIIELSTHKHPGINNHG